MAILVFSADELDKRLSKISSGREKQEALYEQISLDSVKPSDVVLVLSGHSESHGEHPKFLFHHWVVQLRGEKASLLGVAVEGHISSVQVGDEFEGTEFDESRTFSQFTGDFGTLLRTEAWNGTKLDIAIDGERNFFPEDWTTWIMEDEDKEFGWKEKAKIDDQSKPEELRLAEWTMLPMSIHAELLVKSRLVAQSDGYIVYSRDFYDPNGYVHVVMPSLAIGAKAFPTRDDLVQPPNSGDLASCMRLRIVAWICCLVAVVSGSVAASVQLRSKAKTALAIARSDAPQHLARSMGTRRRARKSHS